MDLETLQSALNALVSALQCDETLPAELGERAQALLQRLGEGQLHLAVLGQFKRGKSTLLNALLGAPVLPEGVLPVTAIPTFLYGASQPHLEVFTDGVPEPQAYSVTELPRFVAESHNPQNHRGVQRVNLFYPASLLQEGLVLIDTPGIGSTNENNTETTLRVLPHCDAAIVVFSTDPPITAAEVDFLLGLQPHIAHYFFVLNKIDYLAPEEVAKAEAFLAHTLRDALGERNLQIFALSARQGLIARQNGDEATWQSSGMATFAAHLRAFAQERSQMVLQQAVLRKATDVVDEALHLLALRREALQLPLAALEQKMITFQTYAEIARHQRQDIADRLTGDEERLRSQIDAAARQLRERAQTELDDQVRVLDLLLPKVKWAEQARDISDAFFDSAREQWHCQVRDTLQEIMASRSQEIVALREQLRHDAADLLQVPHSPLLEEENIIDLPAPIWVSGTSVPLPQEAPFWEKLLPPAWQEQCQIARRQELVLELASRNTERVRWWLLQMVQESVRRFRSQLVQTVEQTIGQVEEALEAAHRHHREGAASRKATLSALEHRRQKYLQLRQTLAQPEWNKEQES